MPSHTATLAPDGLAAPRLKRIVREFPGALDTPARVEDFDRPVVIDRKAPTMRHVLDWFCDNRLPEYKRMGWPVKASDVLRYRPVLWTPVYGKQRSVRIVLRAAVGVTFALSPKALGLSVDSLQIGDTVAIRLPVRKTKARPFTINPWFAFPVPGSGTWYSDTKIAILGVNLWENGSEFPMSSGKRQALGQSMLGIIAGATSSIQDVELHESDAYGKWYHARTPDGPRNYEPAIVDKIIIKSKPNSLAINPTSGLLAMFRDGAPVAVCMPCLADNDESWLSGDDTRIAMNKTRRNRFARALSRNRDARDTAA